MEFKKLKLSDTQIKFASDGKATFTGYASVFGGVDDVGDTIHKGAFAEVLAVSDEVKMYFNHGWLKGELPIGKMRLAEDDVGLYVKSAEFTDGISLAGEVASAVRHGTVDGLSVAISSDGEGIKRKSGGGHDWFKVKRLREVSVVADPADNNARIMSVKAALDEAQTLKEIETLLREAGGFSRADAVSLVARIKSMCQSESDAEMKARNELRRLISGSVFIPS